MAPGADTSALLAALEGLGGQVDELRLPLDAPGGAGAVDGCGGRSPTSSTTTCCRGCAASTRRCSPWSAARPAPASRRWSTPWSRQRVSAAGVLRPTTRSAVLAYNPAESDWFEEPRVLPGLRRATGASSDDPTALQLAPSEDIPAGLAVLDAPDIDSVVTANRELATQLLAAADMWVFVTTAARYADAVPWEFLRSAVTRGTAVAVVLDRVPPEAIDEVRAAPRPRCSPSRASAARRCSSCPRRRRTTRCSRTTRSTRSAAGCTGWPPTPPCAPPSCGTRSTARCARSAPGSSPWPRPPTSRPRSTARLRARGRRGVRRRRSRRSTRPAATGRCCAARCWRAGRSSSAPVS